MISLAAGLIFRHFVFDWEHYAVEVFAATLLSFWLRILIFTLQEKPAIFLKHRKMLLSQSCLTEVWFDFCVSRLYICIYVSDEWQMASVSHLYFCFFTDELVSNVAVRSVMIHCYVWKKIRVYFCIEQILFIFKR